MAENVPDEQGLKVPIRVLLDKEKNKVVYAEAGKDFVDVLLSFLTLPLGTIARLVAKESNIEPVRFGSLGSLYQSVVDLDEEHLWTETCKEMLLQPKNSMEAYIQQMKLNIDDTESKPYFMCEDVGCHLVMRCLSNFRNQKCHCGKLLSKVMSKRKFTIKNGFVKETATFIVCDDLRVMPNVLGTSIHVLQKNGINNIEGIEKKTVLIGKNEVIDLLKLSLVSKTPLTYFILKKKQFIGNSNLRIQSEFGIGKVVVASHDSRMLILKVMVRKSKILFAEAEEDFADILFSFLTFPLGEVLHMLEGFSSVSSMDSLYNSMKELSPGRYLRSQRVKEKLVKPQIALQFELRNQVLPTDRVAGLNVFYDKEGDSIPLNLVDPKSPISGGFTRGPSTFMVTDDLVVTPMSSIDCVSYLERMKVPLNELEERVIPIGVKECLSILNASLTSTSALTNGLNQYIAEDHFCL